jgi:hypothetical protein
MGLNLYVPPSADTDLRSAETTEAGTTTVADE